MARTDPDTEPRVETSEWSEWMWMWMGVAGQRPRKRPFVLQQRYGLRDRKHQLRNVSSPRARCILSPKVDRTFLRGQRLLHWVTFLPPCGTCERTRCVVWTQLGARIRHAICFHAHDQHVCVCDRARVTTPPRRKK